MKIIDFELDMNIVLRSGCGYVWPPKKDMKELLFQHMHVEQSLCKEL